MPGTARASCSNLAVTDAGIAEAQRWLRETTPDRTVRRETILRLFMLWFVESHEAIAFFDDELEHHRQRLDRFEATLAEDELQRREHGTAQGGIAFCASLALEWGIRYERQYLAWVTQARDRIANGAEACDDARERQVRPSARWSSASNR